MADAEKKAREELRRAQAIFERAEADHEKARRARRASYERAHKAGLSLRDIGAEIGLHHTRVGQIIRGE